MRLVEFGVKVWT